MGGWADGRAGQQAGILRLGLVWERKRDRGERQKYREIERDRHKETYETYVETELTI